MKIKGSPFIYGLFAGIGFVTFSWDLNYDHDFFTYLWLILGVVNFFLGFFAEASMEDDDV